MKLVLTNAEDIVQYVQYLNDKGSLTEEVGEIVLDELQMGEFLQFKNGTTSQVVTGFTPKRWTTEEDTTLMNFINNEVLPSTIAQEMNRSEGSIRSRANKVLGKGFSHNSWHNLT